MKKFLSLIMVSVLLMTALSFTITTKAASSQDLLIDYMAKKSGQDNKEDFFVKKIGDFDGYTLFYGKTADGKKIKKSITYGKYAVGFNVNKKVSPYILGLYFVKGDNVYTFDSVYKNKLLDGRQIYLAGEKVKKLIENGDKDFNFTMMNYALCGVGYPEVTKISAGTKLKFRCCDYGYKYKTSDEKVAIVKNGKVIGLKKGTVTITSYQVFGNKITRKFKVVTNPKLTRNGKNIKDITVSKGKIVKVRIEGKSGNIKNKYYDTGKARIISDENSKVIKIKGNKVGNSYIKIKVNNVKTLRLKVKVIK